MFQLLFKGNMKLIHTTQLIYSKSKTLSLYIDTQIKLLHSQIKSKH